ncbi:uncharacterized protein E0L32_004882 [Thyridium curvatum]|uniref:Ubiquitin-protein ligase n=1 Tax=Thyridium curvatum TaxID=1093900 RepID=A0A507AYJ0_9PEZI|nr:uncharacterized protein E0L32_004882 [Thyridium curvatum]TPX15052.1 hypothetical protein E0L32_004882 [Thyridium curvatum]
MADTMVPPPSVPVVAAFDNSSMWHNFTSWTAQHLGYLNMSKLAPSLEDLVWAGPRMVMKLGKLGSFISFPDAIDGFGQRVIPEATDSGIIFHATTAPPSGSFAASAAAARSFAAATQQGAQGAAAAGAASPSRFSLEGARGLGSVFSYATSKWALCCIAMAIVLNRTHIFAATRRRLRLRWQIRLLLRFLPIVLLALQARRLLQSIQCQTSPDFAEMRWGDPSKKSDLMFSQTSTFLHGLSSKLLLGASDLESCLAVKMVPPDDLDIAADLRGSLSRLWPLFGTFCLSQFLETVSCAVQGRAVAAETGMTLFEHSLAFAEADAAISNQLGWGLFTSSGENTGSSANLGANIAISRAMILRRVNTPPEVLLVAFLSSMSHMTSHVLGVFNLQSKFRLVSTGFWAMCFMSSIIWNVITFSVDDPSGQGLLRFPTVCIIGFIPHVMVLCGIIICFFIYGLALLLTTAAQPDDRPQATFRDRLRRAHSNMQANVSLGEIRISWEMDFYTALLRAGFGAITMASEAVYLNEDRKVNLKQRTWLEDERLREIEELRMHWIGSSTTGARFDSFGAIGLVPAQDGSERASSGYARERVAQKVRNKNGERMRPFRDGVGAAERSGRWLMAMDYLMHINRLVISMNAILMCRMLAWCGVRNPPRWLLWLAQRPKGAREHDKQGARPDGSREPAHEWLPSATGRIQIPRNDHVDVEMELRRRLQFQHEMGGAVASDEHDVDNRLYGWWLRGGWWGNTDSSGDFAPSGPVDEDATSVITTAETDVGSEADWESDRDDDDADGFFPGLDDGQRTPTQRSPFASREGSPVHDHPMAMSDLARLLSPRSPEEREEARTLAAHLGADGIMTRSSYRRFQQRQRAQVLAPIGGLHAAAGSSAKLTPEEEAQLLEQILLSRRAATTTRQQQQASSSSAAAAAAAAGQQQQSWAQGAAGLGPDGPQCVVCQSVPRTIIVWPCRCLSLCDDCRVSLAMNNFDKCVCCRREVISFSRIYVP